MKTKLDVMVGIMVVEVGEENLFAAPDFASGVWAHGVPFSFPQNAASG